METEVKEPEIQTPTISPTHTPDTSIADKISNAFAKYWNVVVWNDDVHTFPYVIIALMQVVGCSEDEASQHAERIHTEGKSVVASETQEKAELYHGQLTALELT